MAKVIIWLNGFTIDQEEGTLVGQTEKETNDKVRQVLLDIAQGRRDLAYEVEDASDMEDLTGCNICGNAMPVNEHEENSGLCHNCREE